MASDGAIGGAGALPTLEEDGLDRRALELLGGKVVRKDLTSLMRRGANVPTFVLEYLLGMYCSTDDEELVEQGVSRIRRVLAENYVRPDESEAIKSRVRELGQYTIIDRVSARLDEFEDEYVTSFGSLSVTGVTMPEEYIRDYTKILEGGMWCIVRLEYARPGEETDDALVDAFDGRPLRSRKGRSRSKSQAPFRIVSLRPIQIPRLDMDGILEARAGMTAEEWGSLLLRSCRYEPAALTPRERLHFIERMVPLAERNYNLCELGPRGTGKSHIYKEVSPYAILLSGGQTTTANLFGRMNASRKATLAERTGIVGCWDCVTFDEVAGMHFRDTNAIQIMKDYMASGSFARGRDQVSADASMVYGGHRRLRLEHAQGVPPLRAVPAGVQQRQRLLRQGPLLPPRVGGTEDEERAPHRSLRAHHGLPGGVLPRDKIGVRKTFSGLSKLLFPSGNMTREEAEKILRYAIEGRRRVKEQLRAMTGVEFMDLNLGYSDIGEPGSERVVYVPERSEATLVPEGPVSPGYAFGVGRVSDGEWAVYRLENKAVPGSFQFKTEGIGNSRAVHESMEASFRHFDGSAAKVATGLRRADKDYLLFMNDLQGKGPSDEGSLAEFVGLCSAACNRAVEASLVIPGVIRLSGSMDEITGIQDIFRVTKGAGAKKILLPLSCLQDLQSVPAEFVGSVSPEFYPDGVAVAAARKALGL